MALTVALAVAGAILGALLAYPHTTASKEEDTAAAAPTLTHAQEVWKGALEWCESRGNVNAINPKDRDNTPSYGPFQFKPSTLVMFGVKYGVLHMPPKDGPQLYQLSDGSIGGETDLVMDYPIQDAVLTEMILHRSDINWANQFPDCVKRLGYPPRAE